MIQIHTLEFVLVLAAMDIAATSDTSADNLLPADLFKAFISSPPIIEDIVYRRKLPPPRGRPDPMDGSFAFSTNYAFYYAKWQTNALFYRQIRTSEEANQFRLTGRAGGFTPAHYWFIAPPDRSIYWRSKESSMSDSNRFVCSLVEEFHYDFAEVLNMGIKHLTLGAIRWRGDEFEVRQCRAPVVMVKGKLARNQAGFADHIRVSYTSEVTAPEWVLRYTYATNLGLLYIPSRIKGFFIWQEKETELDEISILRLSTRTNPLPLNAFSPEPFLATNRLAQRHYKDQSLYVADASGEFRLVQRLAPSKLHAYFMNYSRTLRLSALYSILVLGNIGIFILAVRIKDRYKQQT